MNCPVCQNDDSRVLSTRDDERRRECCRCHHRWTTVEVFKEAHAKVATVVAEVKALAERLG